VGIHILAAVATDALILNRMLRLWARSAVMQLRADTNVARVEKEKSHGA